MKTSRTAVLALLAGWLSVVAQESPGAPGVEISKSNLPLFRLAARGRIVSEVKTPCSVGWVLPVGAGASPTGAVQGLVRIHGASSQAYPKKSFAVTLEKAVRLLDLRESPHWVLNAAAVDRSLMRHKLSYDLFRAMSGPGGKRYASGSRFVEVELNGNYQGVYLLMERVDGSLLELQKFQSNRVEHACIFKAIDHGGDFASTGHDSYEQREPDPLVREYWKPLDELNRFVSRARDSAFRDPETGIRSRFDVANAIDFHLLLLVTSNMDGYDKNLMVARDLPRTNAPSPRFFFVPWDYDATFGRNWEGSRVRTTAWLSNHLLDRLLEDPEYQRAYAARWKELRQTLFSEASILAMIDGNVRTLGAAVRRNDARWAESMGGTGDGALFAKDIGEMKQWVSARLKWLDTEIESRTEGR